MHEPGLARLLSRKAEVAEDREQEFEGVPTAPGPQAPPTPAHAAPPEPQAPEDEAAPEDTFARLRAAKERARRREQEEQR
jgi:hypothetical protein